MPCFSNVLDNISMQTSGYPAIFHLTKCMPSYNRMPSYIPLVHDCTRYDTLDHAVVTKKHQFDDRRQNERDNSKTDSCLS